VPTRFGENIFTVRYEDVGENVIRELRYGWRWRRTCRTWISMAIYEAEGTYEYVEQSGPNHVAPPAGQ
jgi:hypothetical protein